MPAGILDYLRKNASQMAYNSALYNWSLRSAVPERLSVRPADPWPGKAAVGQALCEGQMPTGYSVRDLHGFEFLRDLQVLARKKGCGPMARSQARYMVESWVDEYGRWQAGAWDADVMGVRIAMWISHYEFYASVSGHSREDDYHFQDALFESLVRQACHLSRMFVHGEVKRFARDGIGALQAAKGLIYAGLAFEEHADWAVQGLEQFEKEIEAQVAGDGMHKSGCPERLLNALQIALDVRMALVAGGRPASVRLDSAVEKMGQALQFFKCSDKKLALFHGGQEGDVELIESVLMQAGARGKGLHSLPFSGFEKMVLGRTSLIFDCGAAPEYSAFAHAAPLAFEMSHGRERLFVNCGTHPSDAAWQDAMRASAAHNGAVLDQRNAYDIKNDGYFSGAPKPVKAAREEGKNFVLVEAGHDGYQKINGFTHRRRLYLSDDGYDVRGEDVFEANADPAKTVDVAVRFHLHPRVKVSLVRDGHEALLRLPGGVGWRFHFSSGFLALEDSVYLGDGCVPRKTKQLVLYGQVREKYAKISWALQKEGQ